MNYYNSYDIYSIPEIKKLIHSYDFHPKYYEREKRSIRKKFKKKMNIIKQHNITFQQRLKRDNEYNTFVQYYFYNNWYQEHYEKIIERTQNEKRRWYPDDKFIIRNRKKLYEKIKELIEEYKYYNFKGVNLINHMIILKTVLKRNLESFLYHNNIYIRNRSIFRKYDYCKDLKKNRIYINI